MTVREFLGSHRGSDVHVLPNPGNCGDGLVYLGLRQLFKEFELRVCELFYPLPANGQLLLIQFNGNLCGQYHSAIERVGRYARLFEELCLLPGTIDPVLPDIVDFLKRLPANTTVFCRERRSAELMSEIVPASCRVWTDHDLAFEANVVRWQREGNGALVAFRDDAESILPEVPPGNFDVSSLGGEWMAELFLDVISSFEEVYTDHVHVAIAAAMLNKSTHLYKTAYHKVRAMYEFSLAAYPHVWFHETFESIPRVETTGDPRFEIWRNLATEMHAVRARDAFS